MARIPEEEIERIKHEVSVADLARARGVVLKRHGSDLIGLCPFHNDHQPSLVITPSKNLWHCLGACKTGGSVIDWVMKAEGVSFRHAVELLRDDRFALKTHSLPRPIKRSRVNRLPSTVAPDVADGALLGQVIDYYHATLKQSPEALAYLKKRALDSEQIITHFKLGYANRTLGYRIPTKTRKQGIEIRTRLQKLGILRPTGHEHFNGSLIIPVFDEQGTVCEIYGRKIRDDLRTGTPAHLYLPGPHKGVWNIQALKAHPEIILCESLIDALTFWCAGYRNVTTAYGTAGFTDEMLLAFKHYRTERILIAYDRDAAGDQAARALSEKLLSCGISCYRIHFAKGMDANEHARKITPPAKSLALVIRNAVWLGNGRPRAVTPQTPLTPIEPPPEQTDRAAKEKTPPEPPPASPEPPAPSFDVPIKTTPREIIIQCGDRRYRIRGLAKNMSPDQLKVNILCTTSAGFHIDTLDLYSARHRTAFIKQASEELALKEAIIKKDIGAVLLKLEELQEAQIKAALEPEEKPVMLTDKEKADAMALLKDPALFDRILADLDRCGIIGEKTNKLTGYIAAVSRKLDRPLGVIIQSSSAAGKSMLMEAILAFMPEQDRVTYSAMTAQSLFYMQKSDLKHKILAIAEEEGAHQASYALKLLQSEAELTIASTGKDPATGKFCTHEYRVKGPVMVFLTTTAIDIDEEFLNRCLVLTVNEDRAQTRAIHCLQRKQRTLKGLLARKDRAKIIALHRNAQSLLQALCVVNPYAPRLTFCNDRTRTRRDHEKYLTLIDAVALLHQHQRPIHSVTHHNAAIDYIEVTLEDIAIANRLAHEILGRTLDELPPQSRRLLMLINEMAHDACARRVLTRSNYRFSRRDVRQYTGWSDFQVKAHMKKLQDLEYVLVHRGGRGQSYVYELLYQGEGQNGTPFLMGLLDIERLKHTYDTNKEHPHPDLEGVKGTKEGPRSPQRVPKEAPRSAEKTPTIINNHNSLKSTFKKSPKNTSAGPRKKSLLYGHTNTFSSLAAVPDEGRP